MDSRIFILYVSYIIQYYYKYYYILLYILFTIASWHESHEKPRQCVEKQRHHSDDRRSYSQGNGLPKDPICL